MIRTLVVDDDFRVARIHTAYVQRVPGFEVIAQTHTAAATVDAVSRLHPDLLLLDLYLPDRHGLELIADLRQGHARADIIVITAARDVASLHAAVQSGALHYLLKPFTFPALRERLISYAAMRAQLSGMRRTDQRQVDRVLGTLRGPRGHEAVKGGSAQTLESLLEVVLRSEGGVTARQAADAVGLSRATAQRYLAQLADTGRISIELRYGGSGRPEHLYRAGPGSI